VLLVSDSGLYLFLLGAEFRAQPWELSGVRLYFECPLFSPYLFSFLELRYSGIGKAIAMLLGDDMLVLWISGGAL